VMSYQGSGAGGRVPDASTYTMGLSARALGEDDFTRGKFVINPSTGPNCLTRPPASQVVSQRGNSDGSIVGLNMGYTAVTSNGTTTANVVGVCTQNFYPLTESQFVDTIPAVKFHTGGSAPQPVTTQTAGGRQVVQNEIDCTTTDTYGNRKTQVAGLADPKADVPFNSYSARPYNPETAKFVTGVLGPQVGGGTTNGSRAPKVGGPAPFVKRMNTHRGWGGRNTVYVPYPRVPPRGAPAQLKINDPNHYKV